MISSNNLWKGIGLAVGAQAGYPIAWSCFPERNHDGEIVTHPIVYGARLVVGVITALPMAVSFESQFSREGQGSLAELAKGVALIALTYFAINVCGPVIASRLPSYEVTVMSFAVLYFSFNFLMIVSDQKVKVQ